MIAAKEFDARTIQRAYNRRSWVYSKTIARMEWQYHLTAIEMAHIQPGKKVLEVAVGPGLAMLELAKHVGRDTPIYGVDISTSMLKLATQNLHSAGFSNLELKEADSRDLPFDANQFDVVYNAYMLDLIPMQDMPIILKEYYRVLRPGGRLILLNMSKSNLDQITSRERLYQVLPDKLVLYLMGGCRPVLMESSVKEVGFENVSRVFLDGKAPSEVVLADKPG